MKRLKIQATLKYDDKLMHGDEKEEKLWFVSHILGDKDLVINSGYLGDDIGYIKIHNLKEIKKELKEDKCN